MKKQIVYYPGWELKAFDKAKNFRNYQYSLIKKFIKGRLVEIGPGNGSVLKLYIKKVKSINLFEPSKNLFLNLKRSLKRKKNIRYFNRQFKLKKNYYDSILYLDVLEHITGDKAEFLKAYKSLKKGGCLIINVPAFQYLYSKFDSDIGHVKRYEKKFFKQITKKLNGNIKILKYYDSLGYFFALISKIFKNNYKKNFKQKIMFWNSLIFISKIIDIIIFNRVGKSLIFVFEKK